MPHYLQDLNTQLADGLACWPAKFRLRHAHWFARQQNADGGFSGREGDSDLYYTGFALRALSVLDALTPEIGAQAAEFLRGCLAKQASVVDFFSLLYATLLIQASGGPDVFSAAPADWPERVAATLAHFRTPDHGYNKSPGAASGSTYHTFLVGLCHEILGMPIPGADQVLNFTLSRRREDGGFVEVAAMRRSGTNPTAAGVGLLHLLKGRDLPADDCEPTIAYLAAMVSDEGGLRANDRIPLADLLSTFTGCWTLHLLGGLERIDTRALRQFAQSLEQPEGGFFAGFWDERSDVEYSFYGLGVLALLPPD